MIVTIKAEIFNNSNNHSDLDDLMHFFRKGKHKMNLKKKVDFDAFDNSDWTETLSISDKDFLRESISNVDKKEIIVSETINETEFNLKEAYAYLQQPLSIIIENAKNDSPFINCIFKNFGDDLLKGKNKHWIKFEHGGGANNDTIISMMNEQYNDSVFNKSKEKYLRCFVIKDSDREYCIINSDGSIIEQKLSTHKTKFLEELKIPFHILYKREMENYMTNSVFNNFLQTAKKNDAKKEFSKLYLKLNPHQKDFFDIENGFSLKGVIKEREKLDPQIKDLYKDLSNKQYRKIGLGLPFSNFKSEFSKHFENVTKEDLEKRIQHQPKLTSKVNPKDITKRNEFDHIIHEIKYLL